MSPLRSDGEVQLVRLRLQDGHDHWEMSWTDQYSASRQGLTDVAGGAFNNLAGGQQGSGLWEVVAMGESVEEEAFRISARGR